MELSSVVLFVATIVAIGYYFLKRHLNIFRYNNVEFIKPTFPFGSLDGDIGKKNLLHVYNKRFYDQHKGKPFIGYFMTIMPFVLCTNLDFIKRVLVKDFSAFADRGMYVNEKSDPLSAHMFSVNGDKWKKLRSKLSPTFSSGKMKLMFSLVLEKSNNLKKKFLECAKTNQYIDSQEFFARYTTDVIASCAFGIECDSIVDEKSLFRTMGKKVFNEPRYSGLSQLLIMCFRSIALKLNISVTGEEVTHFFMKVVRDTIDYRNKSKVERPDFMSLLMKIMQKDGETKPDPELFSFDEVAAQAFVFYLAGFETSSTLLTFCTYELAKNPELQQKARDHVMEVLERHNGEFTYEAMMDMKYLEQVLNESLRKYPPVAELLRYTTRDYTAPDTNMTIPNDMNVVIPVYAIQHDPEIYPEPEVFDPDRFTEEEVQKRHPMAFLPFGEGPRNCVGLRFGLMQARIALVMLLTNFSFSFNKKTVLPMTFDPQGLVLKPNDTIYFDLKTVEK